MTAPKRFVKVVWHDASDDDRTWLKPADAEDFGSSPLSVISWGWLVHETKAYVTIAADYIPEPETYGRVTKIPRGMVQSLEDFLQE